MVLLMHRKPDGPVTTVVSNCVFSVRKR